ncbi:MAG: CARDB domain-containing protein, partial [Bacteroidales bacterium]
IPKDAGVTDIALPDDSVQTGSEVTVKLTIHNFGTDSLQMIPVRYFISGGAVVAETWHGTLLSGESTDYTFTTTYPSPGTAYQICAFTKRTGDIYWGNDTTCKFINPTPANHDVGISEILEPGEYTPPGEDVTVKVRIKNYGLNPEASIPLVYLKNLIQVGAGIYTGTINPGDSADYTFTTTFISPTGNYNLCAKTMLTGDEDPVNDEKCIFPFGGTGMEEYKNKDFELLQNIPNPATEVTTIIYKTLQSGRVIFEITDILGRKIFSELYDAISGINTIELNVSEFPAGLYYYSVIYKDNKLCKRMIILK